MIVFQLTRARLPALIALAAPADAALLLRGDAVHLLSKLPAFNGQIYALKTDVEARGLLCPAAVVLLDDNGWVQLCANTTQVLLCQD